MTRATIAIAVRVFLAICLGSAVIFLLCLGVVWASGWFAVGLDTVADFGATSSQCEATFGRPTKLVFAKPQNSPRSVVYFKKGWFIMIGYDEQDRAEQFVFCKAKLPDTNSPPMSEQEQKFLLGKYQDGSTWTFSSNNGNGPIWQRDDHQACASYVADSRWLVLMNREGLDRNLKAMGLKLRDGSP